MSQCVYTGALVLLVEYNACVRGDVFAMGSQILIQWGTPGPRCEEEALDYSPEARKLATHVAHTWRGYHHKSRGITIVSREDFEGEFR